eukprot:12405567-Karenia_brevis.AAC.1
MLVVRSACVHISSNLLRSMVKAVMNNKSPMLVPANVPDLGERMPVIKSEDNQEDVRKLAISWEA